MYTISALTSILLVSLVSFFLLPPPTIFTPLVISILEIAQVLYEMLCCVPEWGGVGYYVLKCSKMSCKALGNHLGRIRKKVTWGGRLQPSPILSFLFMKGNMSSQLPFHHHACCRAMATMVRNCKIQLNASFSKLPWSWIFFFMTTEK